MVRWPAHGREKARAQIGMLQRDAAMLIARRSSAHGDANIGGGQRQARRWCRRRASPRCSAVLWSLNDRVFFDRGVSR
jgi:hypothetical protein